MERITSLEFDERVLGTSKIAVVDFYSDSCMPCKRVSPILAALENQYPHELYVAKVNVAYEGDLVEKYQVMAAPTLLFFKGGREVGRFSGVRTKEELEQVVEANK